MRAIFHADKNWGIGKIGSLMFSLPKDMQFFRETTMGKVVVMGLATLNSFPGGKPLKGRTNILLCPETKEGVLTVHSLEELFKELKNYPGDEVYVIGGASVYRQLLPYCAEALVTKVDADGGADCFAPNLDADPSFTLIKETAPQEDNGYIIRFCTYKNENVKHF